MSPDTPLDAEQFVASINLAGLRSYGRSFLGPQPPVFVPEQDENQALVVGSELQAFTKGVDNKTRQSLQNCVLLAQLVAQQKADSDDTEAWYRAYFDVLGHVGLITEEHTFTEFDSGAVQADVHDAVLKLAASLLGGPATTAYRIIAATISALLKLQQGERPITIFSRETQRQQTGRFQVSIVEEQDGGGYGVSLMAFRFEASTSVTRVLFFKLKSEEARLETFSGKMGVSEDVLGRVADSIAEKVGEFCDGYVSMLQLPDPQP